MKNVLLAFSLYFLSAFQLNAQKATISGFIEDAKTGEKLFGASIYSKETLLGTTSNLYGFYSLTLPQGVHSVTFSYVGFQPIQMNLNLTKDTLITITLSPTIDLKEFEVVATETEQIQERTQMSTIEISMDKLKKLPAFMGERDILKTIQLLPGVQSGTEGSSGMYVRGGGPDQNLILLDGVPVYNAAHLFGFFSVFNADAISNVQLTKGGFPARYGGRLSSVLDIRMKEGNNKEFHGEGSIGLISSKLTLEGPIIKDKTSFIVSGRRTYIDLLTRPIIKTVSRNQGAETVAGYYFGDFNAKINHKINDKHRLFLSTYYGTDNAYLTTGFSYDNTTENLTAGLEWGNITGALRWNYLINKKLFANTTITYSRYNFLVGQSFESITKQQPKDDVTSFAFDYTSGIFDWAGKVDFDYIPNGNHYIKFGASDIYHTFSPGVNTINYNANSQEIDTTFGNDKIYAHEMYIYAEDDIKLNKKLKANIGFHLSGFKLKETFYHSFQPRISARYLINSNMSVKAAYSTMAQYIHLLTNAGIGLPTDLWVPATENVLPMFSNQIAAGWAYTYKKKYEVSVEAYYKTMSNLIEYKDGASFFGGDSNWENKLERGDGLAYGAEFFVQKKNGPLNGWVGYTLSWTNRTFENLNFGETFPYRYDRRHDVSIALSYDFADKADIGLVWVYGTGNAVSLPIAKYPSANEDPFFYYNTPVDYFENRNGYRMPAYHRLDLSLNIYKKKKWGEAVWNVSIYNTYNRQNPFFLFIGNNNFGEPNLRQVALFPIMPSISYAFKF